MKQRGKASDQSKGKILPFRKRAPKNKKVDKEALLLMRISDEIDGIIIKHLEAGDIAVKDVVGLLSHRMGSLMRHVKGKDELWDVCEKICRRQAAME